MTVNLSAFLGDSIVIIVVVVLVLVSAIVMLKKKKNGCDRESCSGCPYSKDCNKKK